MRYLRLLICPRHRLYFGPRPLVTRQYFLNIHNRSILIQSPSHNLYSARYISCSPYLRDKPVDDVPSKVEQSLKILREELQQQQQEKKEKLDAELRTNKVRLVPSEETGPKKEPPKKSLVVRIKDEALHYYHGFRLLSIEIGIAARLVFRLIRGSTLSRRERRQLIRTTSDIFRMVPFLVFIVIPFMEFALPIYLKFLPNALPSTFRDASKEDEKIRRQLKVRLEMAKFMQATLEQLSLEKKSAQNESSMAADFAKFMKKIRAEGGYVPNSELLKYSKLFEDELTLDNLPIDLLRAMCRIVGIVPVGPPNILRFQLTMKLRELKADDQLIAQEGGEETLNVQELQAACRARGMRAMGISQKRLRSNMKQWLELSLNDKVPPSLLLLSRTMFLPEDISFTDRLKTLIGQLPETMDKETRIQLEEMQSGKVDNKARLELVISIEEALRKEREVIKTANEVEEKKRKMKQKEQEENEKRAAEELKDIAVEIKDTTIPLADTAYVLAEKYEKPPNGHEKLEISYKEDLSDLEQVLHNVSGGLHEEKVDLEVLKEQIQEHKVDVDSVKLIVKEEGGEVKETVAARRLQSRVDKLISNASKVLEKVHTEKMHIKEQPEDEAKKENLVSINELLLNLRKLQKVPDDTKVQRVGQVLQTLDEDHDGNVDVNLALQAIELIGTDNVKIDSKQMQSILAMLKKEEELQDAIDDEMQIAKHHGKSPAVPPTNTPNLDRTTEVISEYSDRTQSVTRRNATKDESDRKQ